MKAPIGFEHVPEVAMDLIDRPKEKPWGAGEPTAAMVPSAIANMKELVRSVDCTSSKSFPFLE